MKGLVAACMGSFSGLLTYMFLAMLLLAPGDPPSPLFVFAAFFGGWIVSAILLARGAASLSTVIRRGFLLGAAQWLLMALGGVVFGARAASETMSRGPGSDAAAAGAAVGGGLVAALAGGFSVMMAVGCLIGFAIAYFAGREPQEDRNLGATRKCPECAEMVQQDARKCRFCGTSLVAGPGPSGGV